MLNTESHVQRNHTYTRTHLGTPGYTVTGTWHSSRGKPRAMGIHMDINTHTHTPLKEHTGIQAQRGQTQPHAETQIHKGTGTHSVTLGQSHSEPQTIRSKKANEHRQADTLKDNQTQRHNRRAEGHTQAQADHPQVHSPPHSGLTLEHLGTRPQAAGAGTRRPSAPGAHGSPPGAPRRPECACPRERARPARAATCGRRGARCARGGLAGAARGERLPWRTERDRILMGRPRALPPARRPAPSAHSFLRLSQSRPCPAARPAHPNPRANAPAGLGPGAVGRPGDGRGALRDPQRRPRPGERRRAGRGPGALRGLPGLGTGTKRALAAGSAGAVLETGVGG